MTDRRIVAEWRTKGKDFLTLYHDVWGYSYRGNGCGGNLGQLASDDVAIAHMEANAVATLKSDRVSLRRTL